VLAGELGALVLLSIQSLQPDDPHPEEDEGELVRSYRAGPVPP